MKKIIIFLISIAVIFLLPFKNVHAQSQTFYQAEYISSIYLHKTTSNNISYFSQGRIIRNKATKEIAYCIEPTVYFEDNQIYEETTYLPQFTPEQIQDMTIITHFGFGYPGHEDPKWYPITQAIIWEVADPTMNYHITTSKDPNTYHMYTKELEELRTLVKNYKKSTSLKDQTYTIIEGSSLTLTDKNNELSNFSSSENIEIKENTLTINNPQLGTHKITLEKERKLYNRHPLFYISNNSQNVMNVGDPIKMQENFTLKVVSSELEIKKIDSDTQNFYPQGDASLINSIFGIYRNDDTLLQEVTLSNTSLKIKNLPFGSYYIQEIKPGLGYKLNPEKYHFTIHENNLNNSIIIPNNVIKGKLIIKKEYGTDNDFKPEKNISFNIYHNDKLLKTITTNNQGVAEIELPYGKYKLTQLTSTEGYNKIEPIEFEITSDKELLYNLKNYKIDVPNTKHTSLIEKIIDFIKKLLCGKD